VRRVSIGAAVLAAFLLLLAGGEAAAWERGKAENFATLPRGSTGPEGIAVGPDRNIYVATFGFSSEGAAPGPGRLLVLDRRGRLLRNLAVAGSSPNLLGLGFNPATGALLVVDFGNGQVLRVDPETGASTPFFTVGLPSGLNDIAFDRAGNVYVSDSAAGIVWRSDANGAYLAPFVDSALLRTLGVPPFGANGLDFAKDETALFVANTGEDTVVRIPLEGGVPGEPAVFVHAINGADGLKLDRHGNIWVAANQADEIVVLDPTGRAIAKLGDFRGIDRDGAPDGLLFPASIAFFGDDLLVTNLALDLRLFGLPQTVDSQWTAEVRRYTVSTLKARIPPLEESDRRGRGHR
jgi:sugar lactone lactonase YvrE